MSGVLTRSEADVRRRPREPLASARVETRENCHLPNVVRRHHWLNPSRYSESDTAAQRHAEEERVREERERERERELERMMGLEPTTFCMASRRSSQLSYIRAPASIAAVPSRLGLTLCRRGAMGGA